METKAQETFTPTNQELQQEQASVVIITGLSGAGKTHVMKTLEDLGFYCVDNLPVPLISAFLNLTFKMQTPALKLAVGIDARGEQFLSTFMHEVTAIKKSLQNSNLKILFLNASTSTLLKRFQETRRKHPLADGIDLVKAINKEKKLLEPIMDMADMTLDTNAFNVHELRHWVGKSFSHEQQRIMLVKLVSFGFKYGVPSESNLVYDLRFLPNPHFVPELKQLTGKNTKIRDYLFDKEIVTDYWQKLSSFLRYSLEQSYIEGRFAATVAIGCTGGKHRSVCFVEELAKQQWPHLSFIVHHRDIGKE